VYVYLINVNMNIITRVLTTSYVSIRKYLQPTTLIYLSHDTICVEMWHATFILTAEYGFNFNTVEISNESITFS